MQVTRVFRIRRNEGTFRLSPGLPQVLCPQVSVISHLCFLPLADENRFRFGK